MASVPPADVDTAAQTVLRLLRAQHPDLATLPLGEVVEGWDNVTYRLGNELAVRLPRRVAGAALVAREQRWLPALADELPLPVPSPVRVGVPDPTFPYPWSVVPWFDGRAGDEERIAAITAADLGRFFAALHRSAPPGAPALLGAGPFSERLPIAKMRLRMVAEADAVTTPGHVQHREIPAVASRASDPEPRELGQDLGGPPASPSFDVDALDLDALDTALEAGAAVSGEIDEVWCHGDMQPRNLVVADGRIAAVVGWGRLGVGDRGRDLAIAWQLLDAHGRAAFRAAGEVDEHTWIRARGWAAHLGAAWMRTGLLENDARQVELGRRTLAAVAEDVRSPHKGGRSDRDGERSDRGGRVRIERVDERLGLAVDRASRSGRTLVTYARDHVSVRTPSRPDFRDGNTLDLESEPNPDELDGWIERFAGTIGMLGVKHVQLRWEVPLPPDAPSGPPSPPPAPLQQALTDRGFELSAVTVLLLDTLHAAAPVDVELIAVDQPLDSDSAASGVEFDQIVERRWHASSVLYRYMSGQSPDEWRRVDQDFIAFSVDVQRELVAAGRARVWIAVRHGTPVARATLVHDRQGLGVVEDVVVHPVHRRRGIAAALTHRAVAAFLTEQPGARVGIGAEPGSGAERLYRRLGFVPHATIWTALRPGG